MEITKTYITKAGYFRTVRPSMLSLIALSTVLSVFPHMAIATPTDIDNDGISNVIEDLNENGNPDDDDSDLDGIPDYMDADDDNDGISTLVESNQDIDGDQIPNYLDQDSDGDGFNDIFEGQGDFDGDTIPNFIDANDNDGPNGDLDEDGISNETEQLLGSDPNNPDSDNDSVPDGIEFGNGSQAQDTDGDNIPNILDTDDDGDGIATRTERDRCARGPLFGLGRQPDPSPWLGTRIDCRPFLRDIDTDQDGVQDYLDTNSDGDARDDENLADDDQDGIPNAYDANDFDGPDADPDFDTLTNAVEAGLGTNPINEDSDGDGIPDQLEIEDINNPTDSDIDGIINALDPDDDNDGILTRQEGFGDSDQDGIPCHLDTDCEGDGFPDACEGAFDADVDGDGLYNMYDPFDHDGPLGAVSNINRHSGTGDRDCDGIIDHIDSNDMDGPCCFGTDFFCFGPLSISFPFSDDPNRCSVSPYASQSGTPNPQARQFAQPTIDRDFNVRYGKQTFPLAHIKSASDNSCKRKCRNRINNLLQQKIGKNTVACQRLVQKNQVQMSCSVGSTDLSLWLLRNGLAKADKSASPKAMHAQEMARSKAVGIWGAE